MRLITLTSTLAVAYYYLNNAGTASSLRPLSISGTTVLLGNQTDLTQTWEKGALCGTSSNSGVIAATSGATRPIVYGFTVSYPNLTLGGADFMSTGVTGTSSNMWNVTPFQTPSPTPSASFVNVVIYQNGTSNQQPLGASGTTLTNTYTPYASVPVISNSSGNYLMTALSPTRAILLGLDAANNGALNITAFLCDYSTTTPTYLSKVAIATGNSSNIRQSICTLTATTAVVVYLTATGTLATNLITMSGSSLSVGAQTVLNVNTSCLDSVVSALSSTTLLVYYRQASSDYQMSVLTVSGTSISAGTNTATNGTNNGLGMVALNATTAMIAYNNGSTDASAQLVSISGTVPTLGNRLTFNFITNNNGVQLCAISPTSVVAVCNYTGTSPTTYTQATLLTVNGSSISQAPYSQSYFNYALGTPRVIMVSPTRGFIVNNLNGKIRSGFIIPFSINSGILTFGSLISGSFGYGLATPLGTFVVGSVPTGASRLATAGNYPATNILGTNQIFTLGASN
jgi:hypothetical protein